MSEAREKLRVALAGAPFVAALTVVACASSDGGGSAGASTSAGASGAGVAGSSAAGSAGAAAGAGGSAAGAAGATTCKLASPYSTKNAACNACAEAQCCVEINGCLTLPACNDDYVNCALACSFLDSGDAGVDACLDDCAKQSPEGKKAYDTAIGCADTRCAAPCN